MSNASFTITLPESAKKENVAIYYNDKDVTKDVLVKIEDNKIIILDDYNLNNISNEIKNFCDQNNDIGTIITFDDNGK